MGDTNVRLDGPVGPPAKMLEERHVGRLDMGGHDPAAALAGRRNGEANQRYAEREASKRRKHGEAITLPPLIVGVEREEANRSGRLVITERHDLQRGDHFVELVAVIVDEQLLLGDEHFGSDAVVNG